MKVLQIANVAEKKDAQGKVIRTYATSAAGVPLFANKSITLVKGQFAIVNEVLQTQTFNDKNELVPLDTPVKINQILSVWETKTQAIAAMHEDTATEIEADAYLNELRAKAAKFNVADLVANAAGVEA